MTEKEYTNIDEVLKDFNTVKADTGLEKTQHAKNITISDWNDLVNLCAKTIPNVESILSFLKAFSYSTSENFENTSDSIQNLKDTLSAFSKDTTQNLSKKLDKVTASGQLRAYIVNEQGQQAMQEIRYDAAAYSIAARRDGGRLEVGAPIYDRDAVRKQDLDVVANSLGSAWTDLGTLENRVINGILISKKEGADYDGAYTVTLTRAGADALTADIDLPLEAIKIADVDDQVHADGTRILTVHFADGTSLDFELDEIFEGLSDLVDDKVDTVTFNKKVTELEDELGAANGLISDVSQNVLELADEVATKMPNTSELLLDQNTSIYEIPVSKDGVYVKKRASAQNWQQGDIPVRTTGGALFVGNVTSDAHAASKGYVDAAIAGATFDLITTTSYVTVHTSPENVRSNAILDSIEGASYQYEGALKHAAVRYLEFFNAMGGYMGSYYIPEGIQALDGYGKAYTALDFTKKQFTNKGKDLVLDGTNVKVSLGDTLYDGVKPLIYNVSGTYKPLSNLSFAVSPPFNASTSLKKGNCYFFTSGYNQFIALPTQLFETADEANAWLAQNPIHVRYELAAEPTVTDVSEYLTEYPKYKLIPVVATGETRFITDDAFVAPTGPVSTITYIRSIVK